MKQREKLLILSSRFPFPLEKGDKLRLYHQIVSLSEHFDIYLFSLSDEDVNPTDVDALRPYCKEIKIERIAKWRCYFNLFVGALFRGLPLQVGYFYSSRAKQVLDQFIEAFGIEKVYCQLIRMTEYIKDSSLLKHLDYMDAFSMGVKRRKENAFWLKPILTVEYFRVKKYERKIFPFFNSHSIIADADRQYIFGADADKVEILANGVETNFFKSNELIERKYDVLFVGNMSYPPNIAAVIFLIEKVMPLVWLRKPNCKVLIAGATPDKSVQRLASDLVKVSGWMDDIRMAYWESKVFVAPMFLGSGLQNKLLEAMAVGLPCITTDVANRSLKASPGVVRIANNATDFTKQIHALLIDKNIEVQNQVLDAKSFVMEQYGWDSHNRRLVKFLFDLAK